PAEAVDEIAGKLVQVVAPLGGNTVVESGEGRLALRPRRGAALAPGDGALPTAKLASGTLRPVRTRYGVSVGKSDQAGQAEVDPDAVRAGALDCIHLHVEDHVPFAGLPGQDRGLRLAGQLAVPANA